MSDEKLKLIPTDYVPVEQSYPGKKLLGVLIDGFIAGAKRKLMQLADRKAKPILEQAHEPVREVLESQEIEVVARKLLPKE